MPSGLFAQYASGLSSSGKVTWTNWNSVYVVDGSSSTMSDAAGMVTTSNAWTSNACAAITYSVSTESVWYYWAQAPGNSGRLLSVDEWTTPRIAIHPEQLAQAAEQARQHAEAVAARARLRREADERAKKLLMFHLTPDQQQQYEKDQFFDVHVARGAQVKRYRLTHGWAGNVFLLDDKGRRVERFCIHPDRNVPYADNLLAQKLLLEADEDRFLKIANKTRLAA